MADQPKNTGQQQPTNSGPGVSGQAPAQTEQSKPDPKATAGPRVVTYSEDKGPVRNEGE